VRQLGERNKIAASWPRSRRRNAVTIWGAGARHQRASKIGTAAFFAVESILHCSQRGTAP